MSVTTRQDLYEEIWTDPVTVVARRYGLSDVGLAKLCRRMGVPIPPRGYWAKLRSGAKVKKTRLPAAGHFVTSVHLTRFNPEVVAANEDAKRQRDVLKGEVAKALVLAKSYELHPLVGLTKKRVSQFKEEARNPPRANGVLDVRVSKGAFDRALRLFNALIQEMLGLGATVRVDNQTHETMLGYKGIEFRLSIAEHFKRIGHQETMEEMELRLNPKIDPYFGLPYSPDLPKYDYVASGVLTVTAGSWPTKVWKDSASRLLEDRIQDMVVGMAVLAAEIRKRQNERAEAHRISELRRVHDEEVTARRETELKRLKSVEAEAREWERARQLRSYAAAAEAKALRAGSLTAELEGWLTWVRAKADWIDPLVSVSDPILDGPKSKNVVRYPHAEEE